MIIDIDRNFDQIELNRLLAKLFYTDDAVFNFYHFQHEPRCISNIRIDFFHRFEEWSKSFKECIFWLSDKADTGKFIIARTIASSISDQRHFGASFFFSKNGGDFGHAEKFVNTLAYQLTKISPILKRFICDVIAEQNDITHQDLYNQWKKLIIRLLSKMNNSKSHLMFVIDALDECQSEKNVKLIFKFFDIAKNLTIVQLRVILISRSEFIIRSSFQNIFEIIHQNFDLHDFDEILRQDVEHDIFEFMRHELSQIKKTHNLSTDWVDDKIIKQFVEKSDCLFIYAATICRFIENQHLNSKKQFNSIFHDVFNSFSIANLDKMYLQILRHVISENLEKKKKNEFSRRFKQIVESIVVLFDVLFSTALGDLLFVEKKKMNLILKFLHSLLNISKKEDFFIRLLHPFFRDFFLDKEKCENDCFWIDQKIIHINFVKNCLQLLFNVFKKDICHLKSFGHLAREMQTDQINAYFSKNVQYACRYWVVHLEHVDCDRRNEIDLHDDGFIHLFFQKHFLHWLEALSLMRRISEEMLMIMKLKSLFKVNNHIHSKILRILISIISLMNIPLWAS